MAKGNPIIGRCPCPVKGCELDMAVKRIQPRTDQPGRQRKAGLLYGDCPVHGRFGFDGAPAMQTYIEDHSKKCDESDNGSAPAAQAERSTPPERPSEPKEPARAPAPPKTALTSAPPPPPPPPKPSAQEKRRGLLDW